MSPPPGTSPRPLHSENPSQVPTTCYWYGMVPTTPPPPTHTQCPGTGDNRAEKSALGSSSKFFQVSSPHHRGVSTMEAHTGGLFTGCTRHTSWCREPGRSKGRGVHRKPFSCGVLKPPNAIPGDPCHIPDYQSGIPDDPCGIPGDPCHIPDYMYQSGIPDDPCGIPGDPCHVRVRTMEELSLRVPTQISKVNFMTFP